MVCPFPPRQLQRQSIALPRPSLPHSQHQVSLTATSSITPPLPPQSNYPWMLVLKPLLGALAGGNCAVLKPSEMCEATAVSMKRLIGQYLDPSAVRVLEGGIAETQAMLKEKSSPAPTRPTRPCHSAFPLELSRWKTVTCHTRRFFCSTPTVKVNSAQNHYIRIMYVQHPPTRPGTLTP